MNALDISNPVTATMFPGEICPVPRSWAEHSCHKLIIRNGVDKDGYFGT